MMMVRMRANEAGEWFPLCHPFLYYYTKFTDDDDGLTVKQSGDESKKMRKKGRKTREKRKKMREKREGDYFRK